MSVYSGFSTRQQETIYNKLLEKSLILMCHRIAPKSPQSLLSFSNLQIIKEEDLQESVEKFIDDNQITQRNTRNIPNTQIQMKQYLNSTLDNQQIAQDQISKKPVQSPYKTIDMHSSDKQKYMENTLLNEIQFSINGSPLSSVEKINQNPLNQIKSQQQISKQPTFESVEERVNYDLDQLGKSQNKDKIKNQLQQSSFQQTNNVK
ncbi:UNKNOWN [Stylonychia lemnae]|uniref:Uncharacterized protein n=1 Tax=Stylonychia lemnae TaxID=5949 RepID=A0A078A0N3_STYLE|nr:UNKNOWN [Stylonychia lemnae]|eukprot:CDW75018.1 UNKNOWN [Stylonychia lemnae]